MGTSHGAIMKIPQFTLQFSKKFLTEYQATFENIFSTLPLDVRQLPHRKKAMKSHRRDMDITITPIIGLEDLFPTSPCLK